MRILHLLDHSIPLHSAYSHAALSLLKRQRAAGWHTIQLTGPNQGIDDTVDRNTDGWHYFRTQPPHEALAALPGVRHAFAVTTMANRLYRVARLTRPDLVHAHPPLANALAALKAGRKLGLPVVIDWYEGRHARGPLAQFAARLADAVLVPSRGLREHLIEGGVAPARVTTIPPAVSLRRLPFDRSRDEQLAHQLGLGRGPVIGFFGTLASGAGVDLLLRAMPALARGHPGIVLLLVGDGPEAPALRARAAGLGVRAVFTGRIPPDAVGPYYALADLLVAPRLPCREAGLDAPLKPLEAMARGAVVVASNVGGHRELIEHGRTGILFEAGELGALADALGALLAEPACWPGLRAAARAFVAQERSFAATVTRLEPVYKGLIDAKPRR